MDEFTPFFAAVLSVVSLLPHLSAKKNETGRMKPKVTPSCKL